MAIDRAAGTMGVRRAMPGRGFRREGLMRVNVALLVSFAMGTLAPGAPVAAADTVLLDSLQNDYYTDQTTAAYYLHRSNTDDLRLAVGFTVPGDGTYDLNPVELLVAARINAAQKLTVSLYADSVTFPGPLLGTTTLTNLPVRPDGSGPLTLPFTTVTLDDAPDLQPGGKYWLALSVPQDSAWDVYWYTNRTNQRGPLASLSTINSPDWRVFAAQTLPRVKITAALVPEPAGLAPLGVALLACRTRARARR
jgi:hypothetical protein